MLFRSTLANCMKKVAKTWENVNESTSVMSEGYVASRRRDGCNCRRHWIHLNTMIRRSDTSLEANELQIEIYRSMSTDQKIQIGVNLTALSRELQGAGVRARHPEYSEDQVRLAVIRINLGDALFVKVYPHAHHIVP